MKIDTFLTVSAIFAFVLLGLLIFGGWCEHQNTMTCIEAGYSDYVVHGPTGYCVGVVDCNSVVVPFVEVVGGK